nr:hypothetical protein [Tanacetum cinerariifolium]
MEDKEMKSTTKGFKTNDQENYYSRITSITVNGKNDYELKGKFLDDLHNNAFSVTNREDADSELKEEALRNKAIMEGLINEDVESNNEDDERYALCGNETHELPVCDIRRFEMIKYSFKQDEEYVAVKENKYKDLTSTSEDSC